MKSLIKYIENWAQERNLIKGYTPIKQFLKLIEEFGELCSSYTKGKSDNVIDGIGDCAIVIIIMCKQLKIDDVFIIKAIYDAQEYRSTEKNDIIFLRLSNYIGELGKMLLLKIDNDVFRREIISDIYHIIYFLSNLCDDLNTSLESCINYSYNEIKQRKGKMINGIFLKESDL